MRIIPIFLGLCLAAAITTIQAGLSGIGGWDLSARGRADVEHHQLLGLFASLLWLVAQCAVFVYFLGTGKAIKTAVEKRGLDPDLAAQTRKLKGKTFPFATFSALAVVAAAVLGGAASPSTHVTFVIIAVALNLLAIPFEIRSMRQNAKLMDQTGDDLALAEDKIVREGGSIDDDDAAPVSFLLGRLLLVVGGSTWLIYAYLTIVMRSAVSPWPWFALVSAGSIAAGGPLLWMGRKKAPSSAP